MRKVHSNYSLFCESKERREGDPAMIVPKKIRLEFGFT